MIAFRSFATGLVIMLGLFFFSQGAQAATTTICTIGCDYTTLFDAVSADLPGADGFEIQTGYVFNQGLEGGGNVTLPQDSFLTCDPGTTIGNGEGSLILNSNSTTTVDSCHFDGVTLRAENVQNVIWNNNTFTTPNRSEFHLFDVTNYQITNNEDFSHVRMFNADDGLFENNNVQCTSSADFSIGCFTSTFITIVPHGPSSTTTNPLYISNNVTLTNNTFVRTENTVYTFIDFFGGEAITITGNDFLSPVIQDTSLSPIRFYDALDVNILNNTFDIFLPDNVPAGGNTAIHITAENFLDTTIEHNTIIYRGVDSPVYNICYRVDKYGPANPAHAIHFGYNICTATDSIIDNGFYVQNEILTDAQFTEEYNAFYPVDDAFFIIGTGGTSTSPTTHDDIRPIFRTENADPNDNDELNPASPLLDVNGSTDIGRYSGSRVSTYTIDDDCVVDYAACVSHLTENIEHLLKDGDSVLIAEGTYGTLDSHRALNNVTIVGAGPLTVLDAQSTATGINLSNANGFEVSDLKITNIDSTGGATQSGTHILFRYNGNDYDDSDVIMGTPNLNLQFDESGGCILGTTANDGDPYFVADGLNNIHGVLIDLGGAYLSGLTTSTAPLICGSAPIEVRVEDLFIANGDGSYTYNPTALATAGVSLKAGITTPPAITTVITPDLTSGALRLDNASSNTFTNIVFENNETGITFVGGSDNNQIIASTMAANSSTVDITSDNSGDNSLFNTAFNVAKTAFAGTGVVTARYDTAIRVIDSLSTPLAGITVNQSSANGFFSVTTTTDGSGLTAVTSSIAFVLDSTNHTINGGNYNPYTITAMRSGQNATTSINVNIFEQDTFDLMMSVVTTTPSNTTTGSGGGGLPSINSDGTYPPVAFDSSRSTEASIIPSSKYHYLVKAPDDKNPNTQEDSTVYYIGADGQKHVFINQSVFFSWYCDFSQVKVISTDELAKYPVGNSVTYRPGLRLTKFITSPIVYVVQPGRTLRPIADEETAAKLFGPKWAAMVTDLEDTFYRDYEIGSLLTAFADIRHLDYTPRYPSGELDIKGYQDIMLQASLQTCTQ